MKTLERRQRRFIANFEQISNCSDVSTVEFE